MAGAVKFKDEAEAEEVLGSEKLPEDEVKTPEEPEAVMRTLPPEKMKAGQEAIDRMRLSYVAVKDRSMAPRYPCPNHPELSRHRNKKDTLLPFCKVCYRERGKKNLIPGKGCGSGNIVLAFPARYAAVRDWFWGQVENEVRTPQEQLIYLCKQAMAAEER